MKMTANKFYKGEKIKKLLGMSLSQGTRHWRQETKCFATFSELKSLISSYHLFVVIYDNSNWNIALGREATQNISSEIWWVKTSVFLHLHSIIKPTLCSFIRLGRKTTKVSGDCEVNQEIPLKAPCWSHPLIWHSALSICLWPPPWCLVNFIWHFDCPQLLWSPVQRVQNIITAFIAGTSLPLAQVTSW